MSETNKELKKLEENAKLLNELVSSCIEDKERKEAIMEMMESIGTNYLVSPASSREEYHSSYYGGLFDHSLNVFANLVKANESFELGFTQQEMFTVALLHDVGKAVTPNLEDPHFKDSEPWRKKKLGQGFEPNYDSGFFTNRDRTMYVLQCFNIKLSPQEYQAILLNDGYNVDANKGYAMKEYDLSFWVQVADCWAAKQEKQAK